tara:strand:+ start:1576 stop:2541 length:966 start_codon:yes stop_codon:yes gene_type:complete
MFNPENILVKRFYYLFKSIKQINIKLIITLICLAFIGTSIKTNFDSLANQAITIEVISWLLVSIIFSFLSIVINAYAWKYLIKSIGCNSKNLNIIKLFISTNIYKYLPGGVWHFIARYNSLKHDFSNEKSVESILLEPLLMLVAGLIFVPFASFNILICIICWSSTLLFINNFREFIIKKLKSMKATMFTKKDKLNNRNLVQNERQISRKIFYPYTALLIEVVFILFRFLGFWCCVKAFSVDDLIPITDLISSFSLAWIIGLIVPAAPGGVGVFEAMILFALSSMMPEASLLASLLFYRLVSAVSDIFAALVYPIKRLIRA